MARTITPSARLAVESLENRWNLSALDPLGAGAPAPEPARNSLLMEQVAMNYTKVEFGKGGTRDSASADLVALPTDPAPAHVDYFLKVDGIDGEATDDRNKGHIDLLSISPATSDYSAIVFVGGWGASSY